jgi:hypothetical protein
VDRRNQTLLTSQSPTSELPLAMEARKTKERGKRKKKKIDTLQLFPPQAV